MPFWLVIIWLLWQHTNICMDVQLPNPGVANYSCVASSGRAKFGK